jgi:hypothetical protein
MCKVGALGPLLMGVHKIIGAKVNILRVLFGILFGVLMEYSTQLVHQFHQILFKKYSTLSTMACSIQNIINFNKKILL